MKSPSPLSPLARRALAAYRTAQPGAARRQKNRRNVAARLTKGRRHRDPWLWPAVAVAAAMLLVWLSRSWMEAPRATTARPASSQAVDRVQTGEGGQALEARRPRTVPALPASPAVEVESTEPGSNEPSATSDDSSRGAKPPQHRREPTPTHDARPATLAAEVALIRQAKRDMQAGDLHGAWDRLIEHERRFEPGTLAEDRAALLTGLACRLRRPDAVQRLQAFGRNYPRSPHRGQVEAACESPRAAPDDSVTGSDDSAQHDP